MEKLTLKLGQVATVEFCTAFRKVRALGLPCAYELALCAATIDRQVAAFEEARNGAIKRLGEPYGEGEQAGYKVKPEYLAQFIKEMDELGAKPVELPVAKKLKLGPLTGQLCADDLIPLLELVEP